MKIEIDLATSGSRTVLVGSPPGTIAAEAATAYIEGTHDGTATGRVILDIDMLPWPSTTCVSLTPAMAQRLAKSLLQAALDAGQASGVIDDPRTMGEM